MRNGSKAANSGPSANGQKLSSASGSRPSRTHSHNDAISEVAITIQPITSAVSRKRCHEYRAILFSDASIGERDGATRVAVVLMSTNWMICADIRLHDERREQSSGCPSVTWAELAVASDEPSGVSETYR